MQRIQDRGKVIITQYCPANLRTLRDRKIAIQVFKSINNLSLECMNNKFNLISHNIRTRGNNSLLMLPRVRTEAGRKTFAFYGAHIFNRLPKELRNEGSLFIFKRKIKLISLD